MRFQCQLFWLLQGFKGDPGEDGLMVSIAQKRSRCSAQSTWASPVSVPLALRAVSQPLAPRSKRLCAIDSKITYTDCTCKKVFITAGSTTISQLYL